MDTKQAGLTLTLNMATDLHIVGPSRPSAETNRSVGLVLILIPNMATSWSISRPEPKPPASHSALFGRPPDE